MSHTLDVETGGWDCRHCCVHPQAAEGRGLSGVIKTRHYDLQLLLACRTQQLCLRSNGSGVLGGRWRCSLIPSVSESGLALSSLTGRAHYCWAFLNSWEGHTRTPQTGHSRTSHHSWANSLVTVCDAVLKGVTDHSRGVPTEMRAARDLHTVSCTLHHSCARAGQEGAELANALTDASRNGCHVCSLACNEIAHLRLVRDSRSAAKTSKELLGCSDHEIHGVRAFLHCDIKASLRDCWAELLLCVCDAGFQGTALAF